MLKKRKRITPFDVGVHIIAILLLVLVLYPLWLVLINSISDPSAVAAGEVVLFPKGFSLEGYKQIFRNKDILTGYANTIFYTVFGTLINLIVTVPCGYVLTKNTLPGKNILITFFYDNHVFQRRFDSDFSVGGFAGTLRYQMGTFAAGSV